MYLSGVYKIQKKKRIYLMSDIFYLVPYTNFTSLQTYRKKPAREDKARGFMENHINGVSSFVNGAKHKLQ